MPQSKRDPQTLEGVMEIIRWYYERLEDSPRSFYQRMGELLEDYDHAN